jgi:hypothetical protein
MHRVLTDAQAIVARLWAVDDALLADTLGPVPELYFYLKRCVMLLSMQRSLTRNQILDGSG